MAKFSVMVGTCLNGRVPVDPLPMYYALPNPKAFVSLGDWLYHDGTDDRNSFSCDAVEFPRGSGLVLTLPAPVGGVMPTGSLTVTNGGTGHPVSRTAALIFWVRDATTGADTAWGYLTTNGSGVVTAATLVYGGRAGDYTHSGTRAFTEDTDLWTWAHPESWAYRSRRVVTATTAMRKFMALPLRRYLCPDDHDGFWNGGFAGSYGTKAPPTVTTQAQAWVWANTVSSGVRQLIDQDFHNPAWTNPITPYVPSGLTGLGLTGTESFFKVRYFFKDYDGNGNETDTPTRAVLRLIFLDCLFEKGNYQVGSDDSTRNLISPVQEAWLDSVQASAVAAGIQSIGIMSSKDKHGQNSDGWYTHTNQFDRIAANIQAKNYPTWWHTGDRHVPHAARWRVARGDPADLHIVCATALGATSDALQMYPQMDWADQSPDVPVLGSIVVDTDARVTILGVHDMATGRAKYAVRIPFGSRTASEANTYMAAARVSRPAPSPFTPDRFTSTEFSSLQALVSGDGNSVIAPVVGSVSAATSNAQAINAALSASRRVQLVGNGIAWVDDSLVIGDNTTLEIGRGLKVKMKAGINKCLVKNALALTTETSITGSFTSSGTTGTINHTAHGRSVGDAVYVSGATASGYNGAFLVIAVPSADQLQVRLPFVPSASTATGTVKLRTANRGITICGDGTLDYNGADQTLTNDYNSMSVVMHGILGLTLRDHTVAGSRKYAWLVGGCSQFHWENLHVDNSIDPGSDGLHLMGPVLHSSGSGLYGRTGDDFLSMTIGDYPEWEISRGDFFDVRIDGLHCDYTTRNIWKYCGNSPFTADEIHVSGINGVAAINAAIITDDTNLTGTLGGTIRLRDINAITGATSSAVSLAHTGKIARLDVDGVAVDGVGGAVVSLGSGAQFGDVDIRGLRCSAQRAANGSLVRVASATAERVRVSAGNAKLNGGHIVHLNSSADTASIGTLTVSDFGGSANSSSYGVYHEKGAIGTVNFRGVVIDTFAELYRQSATAATAGVVNYTDVRVSNVTRLSELQSGANVSLNKVYGTSISSLPLKFSTTGQSYRVEGHECQFVGASGDVGVGGSPTLYLRGNLRCDGALVTGATANDEFWNTNSAWSSGSGSDKKGRYGYTGSAWTKLFGPA